jgi:hypothetical protein
MGYFISGSQRNVISVSPLPPYVSILPFARLLIILAILPIGAHFLGILADQSKLVRCVNFPPYFSMMPFRYDCLMAIVGL